MTPKERMKTVRGNRMKGKRIFSSAYRCGLAACLCLAAAGCGRKDPLIDAKEKLVLLVEKYRKKAASDIQVFEPRPVRTPRRIGESDTVRDPYTGKMVKKKYVRFVTARWLYRFGELQKDTEPFRVEAEGHLFFQYHRVIPEYKYKEYEKKTGKLYDPMQDPIERTVEVKIEKIVFEFDMDEREWKEKKREVVFDIYGEEEGEGEKGG